MRRRKAKSCGTRLIDLLSAADMFGSSISLNIDGEDRLTSVPGALLTLFLWSIIIQQGYDMFMDLVEHGNIKANQFTYYDLNELAIHNLADNRQEIAFGFFNHTADRYVELDPRLGFIRLELQSTDLRGANDNEKTVHLLELEQCNNTRPFKTEGVDISLDDEDFVYCLTEDSKAKAVI